MQIRSKGDRSSNIAIISCQEVIRHVQFEISQVMLQGMNGELSDVFRFLGDPGYRCHPFSDQGVLLDPVEDTTGFFAYFIAVPREDA